MISQEARTLNLREEKGRENSPYQSLRHTGPLYPPFPVLRPPLAAVTRALTTEKMVWRV